MRYPNESVSDELCKFVLSCEVDPFTRHTIRSSSKNMWEKVVKGVLNRLHETIDDRIGWTIKEEVEELDEL
jgi:hypothetical protein